MNIHAMLCTKFGSIDKAAEKTGLHRTTLYSWCAGKRKPEADRLRKYEALLGIPKETLRPDLYE